MLSVPEKSQDMPFPRYPWLDWFVPASLRLDAEAHRRARMFIITHLFGPPLGGLMAIYLYQLDPAPGLVFWTIAGVLGGFYVYPLLLRLTGRFNLLALLSVQQLSMLVLFTSYQYGGASSPFLSWLLAVPISAYFYFGRQKRLQALVLTLPAVDLAAFYLVDVLGYEFPQRIPLSAMAGVGIFSVFCALIFVSMLSLNYATIVAAQHMDLEREIIRRSTTETELRNAKNEAERLSASLRLLFDGNPVPMLIYDRPTLRFLEVNDAAMAQYGYSREQFLALSLDEIRPPEDAETVRNKLKDANTPYGRAGTWRHRKANGEEILVDVLRHSLHFKGHDAVLSAVLDVTESKQRAQEIRESEARYRLLAENATDVISRIALDQTRLYVSPSVRDVLGYEPHELIGEPITNLTHPDDAPLAESAAAALTRGDSATMTARTLRKDGSYVWLESSLRLVRDPVSGVPREVVSVSRDVSARQALQEQFSAAKEQAEQASRAKSEFLANMSHELRTPLNAIMGFGDLIEHQRFGLLGNPKYAEYGHDIVTSGHHLLDLINGILDFAKVDAGRLHLAEEIVDVRTVVDACEQMLTDRAAQVGLSFETRVDPAVSTVRGDGLRLKQVLLNLLSNGIKFTPAGGKVALDAQIDPGGDLTIRVSDTGIGIDEHDIATVLEPFGQVRSAFNRSIEGTGLGLPLAKRLAEMHGGSLEIESTPVVGTITTVRLPAERVLQRVA